MKFLKFPRIPFEFVAKSLGNSRTGLEVELEVQVRRWAEAGIA